MRRAEGRDVRTIHTLVKDAREGGEAEGKGG